MSQTIRDTDLETILASLRDRLGVLRARLYVLDADGSYRLAGSLGFVPRFGPEEVLAPGDPLLEWDQYHRRAVYANSPREAGRLANVMEREHYARALGVPIYIGSRLVAVLELQDKSRGALYGDEDLLELEIPISRLTSLVAELGGAVIPPAETPDRTGPGAHFLEPPARPDPDSIPPPPQLFSAEMAGDTPPPEVVTHIEITPRELSVFRGFFHFLLMAGDVEAVVFSLWTPRKADLYVGARRPLAESARQGLMRDLEAALLSAAPQLPRAREKVLQVEHPLGQSPGELADFAGIQTSVLTASPDSALLFTLLFSRQPAPEKRKALKETHRLVRSAVTDAAAASRYQAAYRSLVNAFLEPGVKPYRQLRAHSMAVGLMCRRFAAALRLAPDTSEQITVAGLLHDVGLRELELPYEKIAGRRPLDLQELAIVRQHPLAGEAVLKRIEFPYPVTDLVRHHHERFDGTGYPDRLAGDKIPLGSRIIALAEAFDAMTAAHSYRAPIPREDALAIIREKAGTQFDPELASRFIDLVRADGDAHGHRLTTPPRA
ncbi:MAG: HD domain-containing protein [Thermoanaerobaculia bacterium]|nr:HD domain-containing protein [Thermoanaerobaculia bacterium]